MRTIAGVSMALWLAGFSQAAAGVLSPQPNDPRASNSLSAYPQSQAYPFTSRWKNNGVTGDDVNFLTESYSRFPSRHSNRSLTLFSDLREFQVSSGTLGFGAQRETAISDGDRRQTLRLQPAESKQARDDYKGIRVRDAVRLLFNVKAEPRQIRNGSIHKSPARANSRRRGTGQSDDASMLEAILDLPVDQEFLELFFSILSPSIEPSGLISISIAGLGNFVMVLSEEFGALKIIDADTGNTFVVKGGNSLETGQGYYNQGIRKQNLRPTSQQLRSGPPITIAKFLLTVRKFFLSLIQDNRFIAIVIVFSALWLGWQIHRRKA